MTETYHYKYISLLIEQMEKHLPELSSENRCGMSEVNMLKCLYGLKTDFALYHAARDVRQRIDEIEIGLSHALQPAMIDDPLVLKVENKPDLTYKISGIDYKFKVDTGAVTSVVDAEKIDWTLDATVRENITSAYDEYVIQYPDDGAMTKQSLSKLSAPFQHLDFGQVESFDLVVHRQGKAKDAGPEVAKDDADVVVPLNGPFPVVGISNPKVKGERQGLRPVINLPVEGPGFAAGSTYPFSLNKRDMTRRGLVSRTMLGVAGMHIVFSDIDTRILDFGKINFGDVRKVMRPHMP